MLPALSSYAMLAWFHKGWIDSWFTLVHKDMLVIMKGCIRDIE